MLKASLVIYLIFAVTCYCKLDPSPNFNITNFVGNWNVVGFFSTQDLGLTPASCATLNVTLGTVSRLTLSLNYLDADQYKLVQESSVVVPSPLNKAILISTTSPVPQNNYVVVYYDANNGEAVLVNSAVTLGYVLSRSDNPLDNNFKALASEVLTNNSVPLSNVTFIFNRNCEYGSLKGLTTFDPSSLAGEYYGNAIFTSSPLLDNVACFTSRFVPLGNHLIDVTTNFTFTSGKIIYSESSFLPLPQLASVMQNMEADDVPPFVIIYADAASETYVAAAGDSSKGFVFSTQPTISSDILSQVQHALSQNGLIVSSSNFYTLNSVCLISEPIIRA